jgi:hypothetical protein
MRPELSPESRLQFPVRTFVATEDPCFSSQSLGGIDDLGPRRQSAVVNDEAMSHGTRHHADILLSGLGPMMRYPLRYPRGSMWEKNGNFDDLPEIDQITQIKLNNSD